MSAVESDQLLESCASGWKRRGEPRALIRCSESSEFRKTKQGTGAWSVVMSYVVRRYVVAPRGLGRTVVMHNNNNKKPNQKHAHGSSRGCVLLCGSVTVTCSRQRVDYT